MCCVGCLHLCISSLFNHILSWIIIQYDGITLKFFRFYLNYIFLICAIISYLLPSAYQLFDIMCEWKGNF
ncbi:hypothetical protein HanHA300_Chr14g0543361 [Helianthus annuus]|nr:hypothetical protein HanHA300_Chr14g0543361 [Helianthus annuus]KAJ0487490.1 hypothetical protein HanHA89_Chr14g0590951 [Helianthus annuus]KAJ0657929.1 hypothetical protein HanLR1_Chr14g0552111 [Helianthus annuus]KAJ0661613.1 hypothetical protein HanOQP8_Chr14g0550421 [Helianthus annuus]